jgi:hypothetical protein
VRKYIKVKSDGTTAGAPLRDPAFQRLWLGLSISYLGDQFTIIALLWFVLQLTGSGAAVGLVILCFDLPGVVTGAILGRLLDRYQPRLVMGFDNLARAALIAAIPPLYALGSYPSRGCWRERSGEQRQHEDVPELQRRGLGFLRAEIFGDELAGSELIGRKFFSNKLVIHLFHEQRSLRIEYSICNNCARNSFSGGVDGRPTPGIDGAVATPGSERRPPCHRIVRSR